MEFHRGRLIDHGDGTCHRLGIESKLDLLLKILKALPDDRFGRAIHHPLADAGDPAADVDIAVIAKPGDGL